MPTTDASSRALSATIASIDSQAYPAWQVTLLCPEPVVAELARRLERSSDPERWTVTSDPRKTLPQTVTESRSIGFMEAGETLAPGALYEYAQAGVRDGARVIYSDHDAVLETGRHVQPWFVPDWSPDRLLSHDYVGGVFLVRDGHDMRRSVAGVLAERALAWRYAFLLQVTADGQGIRHIPRVLWTAPADDALGPARTARAEAEADALRSFVAGLDPQAEVVTLQHHGAAPVHDISWSLPSVPRVSVVVPTTGRLDLVSETLSLLEHGTEYADLEVIVLDNSRGLHPEGIELLRERVATVLERDEAVQLGEAEQRRAPQASERRPSCSSSTTTSSAPTLSG